MTVDEQLLYESRVRTRQAAIAGLAGALVIGATFLQLVGPHTTVTELTIELLTAHKRFPLDLIGAIVNAFGFIAVAATLTYLWGIVRARNEGLGTWVKWLAIVGGVIAAISAVAYAIVIAGKANDFATHGSQTYQEAHRLTKGAGLVVLPLLGQFAALLLAIAFVMAALNGMRVGLLTKFMGYLGILSGVLVMFPIFGSGATIVQGFWLLALAYLISGHWPSGVPPAWRTGKAERWPTAAEMREQRTSSGGRARPGRMKPAPTPAPTPETVGAPAAARSRATTSKRKRKKRR